MTAGRRLAFFLGGHDLEMITIGELAREAGCRVHDRNLGWGNAVTSEYRDDIEAALAAAEIPVLVELRDDLGLSADRVIVIDHHGASAGADAPTSLHQAFALLGFPKERWTRQLALVAANDRGHIEEMATLGASPSEIASVRASDRMAQGVPDLDEEDAKRALRDLKTRSGGELTVVRIGHSKTSAVADRLDRRLGGQGYRNLLVLCPGEIDFFGEGELVTELDHRFPGGWLGGALPARGFWGHASVNGDDALDWLERRLTGRR